MKPIRNPLHALCQCVLILLLAVCAAQPVPPSAGGMPAPTLTLSPPADPPAADMPPTATAAHSATATATPTPLPTRTSTPDWTVDQMIEMLYVSDPEVPQYDPTSPAYAAFPDILYRLTEMGEGGINAASHVAVAMRFPRKDAFLAAQALVVWGPEITATTLPILIDNLHMAAPTSQYAALDIATVGKRASCAVGDLGPLLWDPDPAVRASAAYALARITGERLLPPGSAVWPDPADIQTVQADTPEGAVTAAARAWWKSEGEKINWHPSYGLCDP